MKKKILLMLLMSVVVLTMAVCGASGETFDKSKIGTVIIGYDGTYPPFNFMDDNAEPTGFEIEMISEIGKRAGLKIKFQAVPWDGVFGQIDTGLVHSLTLRARPQQEQDGEKRRGGALRLFVRR